MLGGESGRLPLGRYAGQVAARLATLLAAVAPAAMAGAAGAAAVLGEAANRDLLGSRPGMPA